MKVLKNGFNHPELRRDFESFCQRMRLKWHIRDEPTSNPSETINFSTKVSWKLREDLLIGKNAE